MKNSMYAQYAEFYKKHICEDVMPFWDQRCLDLTCGGYLTCFDREGNLTDDNKYVWFQGRQLYTYALLYNHIEPRQEWLDAAHHGFRFIRDYAYAGNGRFNYQLDRQGNVIVGTNSLFADMHVIQGLGEYLRALDGKSPEGMVLLNECYDALEAHVFDPYFKDIYENTWQENHIWHDMYMTCLSAVMPCVPVLGRERTRRLLDECVDKICNWFARDEYQMIFETVTWDNQVLMDTPQNRFVNPGHMSEAVWFLMELARQEGDSKLGQRAMELFRWTDRLGYDRQRGGLNAYLDASGQEPVAADWYLETNTLWDDKVWWANAEFLCALAYAHEHERTEASWERFLAHHNYCQEHFSDREYGEWYERLNGDGSVKVMDKGTPWKCAFHLTRALVYIYDLLKRMAQEQPSFTEQEILQQPDTWNKTIAQIASLRPQLEAFIGAVTSQPDYEVILTGAGTSEYVGNALKPALYLPLKGHVQSIGTTDIVASPHSYLSPDKPTLLVSFARSGNSPESVGAVVAADAICKNVRHLFLTCNRDGALAKAAEGRDNCFSIELTPETHDKSFAMTSSFSNMYLAALLAFVPQEDACLEAVGNAVARFLRETAPKLRTLPETFPYTRIVYLGTDVLKGIAQESALKILELTAGKVAAFFDTPMGFRHGPKSVVDDDTLVVVYLSDLPETRRYEMDLLRELRRDQKGNNLLAVSNGFDEAVRELCDQYIALESGCTLPNALLGLLYIPVAQTLALHRSLSLSIMPDDPCPTGEVNRVVKGVTIYPV